MVHQGCVLHKNGKKSKKSTLIPPPLSINLPAVAGQENPGAVADLIVRLLGDVGLPGQTQAVPMLVVPSRLNTR